MGTPSQIPPVRDPIFFDNIPAHVRELNHWVLWRWEQNEKNKWTKPPYCATKPQRRASSDDPKTWATFDEARAAYERNQAHGLGIVVSNLPNAFDDLVAIDLDNVFDPHSKKITDSLALKIHDLARSYTEVSPSGTGIRILGQVNSVLKNLKGHKAGTPGSKNLGYEIYFHHRYVTITGRVLALYSHPLREMTTEATKIYTMIGDLMAMREVNRGPADFGSSKFPDDVVIQKILHSQQGAKFKTLWAGDWQALNYPSQSEADFALCSMLAFWTNKDPDAIDRIFRKSSLMRDKWNREDYRSSTVNLACAGTENVFQHPPANYTVVVKEQKPFAPPAEWLKIDASTYPWNFPKPTVVIERIMNNQGVTLIAAQSQAGKSLLMTNIAMCLTRGGLLFNKLTVKPLFPVWYLVLEDPQYRVEERYSEMLAEWESIPEGRLFFQWAYGFSLGSTKMMDFLHSEITSNGYKCIVIDTFQAATAGIVSFDDEKLGVILNRLRDKARQLKVQIIVVDHLRKKQGGSFGKSKKFDLDEIKGSGVKVQNSDTVIHIEREAQDTMRLHVRSKDHGITNFLLRVSPIGSSEPKFTFLEDLDTKPNIDVLVVEFLEKMNPEIWYSLIELSGLWGRSNATCRRYISRMATEKQIQTRGTTKTRQYRRIPDSAHDSAHGENDNEQDLQISEYKQVNLAHD